jgi:hypothetical protein
VTPLYIAAGYIALVMKNPSVAARLKSRFMRTQEGYESVFSPEAPIGVWVAITEILKKVESILTEARPGRASEGERFLSSWRNLVSFLVVAKLIGTFAISAERLIRLDVETISKELVLEIWQIINTERRNPSKQFEFRNPTFIAACCQVLVNTYGVTSIEAIGRQRPKNTSQHEEKAMQLSPEFLAEVNSRLPEQPWKPGVHLKLMSQLGCTKREVAAAINDLIERGIRYEQKGGIVYDASGKVIAVDASRQSTVVINSAEVQAENL